jgi:hypothetical protein
MPNMNFLLRQIEGAVDECSWTQGEQLVENNAVQKLEEPEKELWVAEVEQYETEVRLKGQKVLEGTCECERYLDIGLCGHIVATLLVLRRQLQNRKSERQKKKQQRQKQPQKLTTKTVLENVELEELASFVREYARTNRNFAIALKARFASAVEAMDSQDKYAQLLDTTIKAVRKSDREITLRGSQRLLKVLTELKRQSEAAQAEGDFLTVAVIAKTIIGKITPLLRKTSGKKAALRQHVTDAFDILHQLLAQQPAPRLKQQLWAYALEEHGKRTFRSQQIDLYFFKLMLQLAQDTQQLSTLLEKLDEHIDTYEQEDRPLAPLLLQKVSTLEKAGREEAARQLMERNLTQPDVLEYAIRQAQGKQQTHRVKALAQTGLRLDPPQGTRGRLEKLLLDIAQREDDQTAIVQYALLRFYDTLDLQYYQLARQHSLPSDWPAIVEEVWAKLEALPFSQKLRDTRARLLILEEDWSGLMAYTEALESLDLLAFADEHLLPRFPQRTKQLYEALIREYARHHLGRQTARRIRNALERLQLIGAAPLARRLLDDFRGNYGERHTLMEELRGLTP